MRAGFSSAKTAAEALGISRIYLAHCESGKATPSWALLARMIALYGVTEKVLRLQLRKAQAGHHKKKLAKTRRT
jgi:DNA-binding XRE family transcriptional regulator